MFCAASLAVQPTVVVPRGKHEPDAGEQTTVAPLQLSFAVGVVKLTAVQLWLGGAVAFLFAGQVTVGG